jgi:hypothetical protein
MLAGEPWKRWKTKDVSHGTTTAILMNLFTKFVALGILIRQIILQRSPDSERPGCTPGLSVTVSI